MIVLTLGTEQVFMKKSVKNSVLFMLLFESLALFDYFQISGASQNLEKSKTSPCFQEQ